jgi:serine phosphatase RsbU (regulator of sigma subunit)
VSQSPSTEPKKGTSLPKVVIQDLKRGDFRHTVRRDLKDVYHFYLDEDERARVASLRKPARWWVVAGRVARGLLLNLSPTRRILLLGSVILALQDDIEFHGTDWTFKIDLSGVAFLLLLFILLLELKDKLLARNELETGRVVQLALLPAESPVFQGWDIWLYTRPANDVGGDLVDYLPVGDRLGVALGDVAGKGLGAALLMAKLQATLRALATQVSSLAELGSRMNEIFWRDQVAGRYATLAYLELAEGSGTVRVLNAGHLPPFIIGPNTYKEMEPSSPPIGILPGSNFVEQRITLNLGETLFVYSDGVTEARNEAGEFFGEERLTRLVPHLAGLPSKSAADLVLADVERFMGEERYSDDLSLIVLRRTG